jgi:Pyridoxamine 5'-phosphate oxidase
MSATGDAQTIRNIIEANCYLVLATADAAGRPWSSPVYFAHIGFTEFFWVSSPEATHSRNIAVRPEVGIAIFDSQVAIGTGQGVYMPAIAELLEDGETAQGIEAFSRRSVAHGGLEWTSEDVRAGAGVRLPRHRRLPLDPRQGRPARPPHSRAAHLTSCASASRSPFREDPPWVLLCPARRAQRGRFSRTLIMAPRRAERPFLHGVDSRRGRLSDRS